MVGKMSVNKQPSEGGNSVTTHNSTCDLACSCIEGENHVCNLNESSNVTRSESPQPSTSTSQMFLDNHFEASTLEYEDSLLASALENSDSQDDEDKKEEIASKRKSSQEDDDSSDSELFPKMFRNSEGVAAPPEPLECMEYTPEVLNPYEIGLFEHTPREEIPDEFNPMQYAPGVFAPADDDVTRHSAYDPENFIPEDQVTTKRNDDEECRDNDSIVSNASTTAPIPSPETELQLSDVEREDEEKQSEQENETDNDDLDVQEDYHVEILTATDGRSVVVIYNPK